jgi:hypothetical protein
LRDTNAQEKFPALKLLVAAKSQPMACVGAWKPLCRGIGIAKIRRKWQFQRLQCHHLVDAGFVAGLIAGWLVGQIIRGTGCDLVADICIGIIDALIGSWPVPNEASTPAPGSRRPLPAPPSAPSRF